VQEIAADSPFGRFLRARGEAVIDRHVVRDRQLGALGHFHLHFVPLLLL
jgi:hypothetical protein